MVRNVRSYIGTGGIRGYQTNIGYIGRSNKKLKNSLSSTQHSTIIEVLGEGTIEGSATASKNNITDTSSTEYKNAFLKDVHLAGTPVLQASASNSNPSDSDFNFKDIDFDFRLGTNNQSHIGGINSIERETSVGVQVTKLNPPTRTITDTDVDAVRVTLVFPILQKIENSGDIVGVPVDIDIDLIQNNGTTTREVSQTVVGKTRSAYFRDFIVNIPSNASFPVSIRVSRPDLTSTNDKFIDSYSWSSFTEIIHEKNAYPDVAHLKLRFDAQQFSSIPSRMFRIRGIKVKVPHNATVNKTTGAITYTGVFNGTFKGSKEWTSDPAWILYDLLTNDRYGAGLSESTIDQFAFFSASVYNSTLVNDGLGGLEPRFSCNVNINNTNEAYDLINDLCAVMHVQPFYSAGSVTISQDRPSDPVYQFTNASVVDGDFTYSGTSSKTRHTVINVGYFDMETQDLDYETVEDIPNINKYGSIVKTIKSFACTSRGQAARMAKWFLFNEQRTNEVCTFVISAEAGVLIRPGQVIQISDRVKSGLRRGGRVKTASTTAIVVDDSANTDLDATNNAKLSVILPDGTLETKSISSIVGTTVNLSSPLSQTPNPNTVWILENDTTLPTTWRIISVTEDKGVYSVSALIHIPAKYAFVEDGDPLPVRKISTLTDIKPAPSNLSAVESIVLINNKAVSKLSIDWQPVQGVDSYNIQYRFSNGSIETFNVTSSDYEIFNTGLGTYEIEVFSINAINIPSKQPASLTVNTVGKTAIPANVQNLRIEPVNNKLVRLRWDASTETDVLHGGFCKIRHSSKTDGTGEFAKAVDIDKIPGNSTDIVVPYIEGEYLVRFIDDGGRISNGSASVVIDLPDPQPALIVQTRREDQDSPKFQGVKTNVAFDATTNSLNLIGAGNFDSITDLDNIASLDDFGGIASSGTYDFNEVLDLGAVFSLDLKHHFFTEGFYPNDLFDSRSGLVDTWQDFDGTTAIDVNAELLVRVTQDDPSSGSATFTAFQTFVNGIYKGRGFQFRSNLKSNDPAQDIKVSQLGYTATLQRRTEQSATAISSGAGAKNITFTHPFFVGTSALLGANSNLPSIGITAQNLGSGEHFEITNVSGTGFTVHFKNSSNASISRNFNFTAVGFGKGN